MPYLSMDLQLIISFILGGCLVYLYFFVRKERIKGDYIHYAIRASNDFYDKADIFLNDPASPDILKDMIRDIGFAVTDERAGRSVLKLLVKSLAENQRKGRFTQPRKEYLEALDEIRKARGDLYDTFHEAIEASFAALLFSYGASLPNNILTFRYDISGISRLKQLGLADIIDRAVSSHSPPNKNGEVEAVC